MSGDEITTRVMVFLVLIIATIASLLGLGWVFFLTWAFSWAILSGYRYYRA